MCLTGTSSRLQIGNNLSDIFPIRKGLKKTNFLFSLPFNLALGYAIKRVQVNQDGLKLNGTLQVLVYVDDVKILRRSVHSVKENFDRC
jgi:hypothetical protein